jgi:replicative DNA helicase
MTGRRCYEVEFSDGTVIVADAEHQWLTMTRAARRYAKDGRSSSRTPIPPQVVTTEEMAATLRCPTADARLNHSVPVCASFDLPDVPLPVDPYLLGVWLGDGTSAAAQITTADPEIVAEIEACGYVVKPSQSSLYRYHVQLPEERTPDRACAVCGKWFSNRMPNVRTCGKVCGGRLRFITAPPPPTCSDCGGPITSYGPRCSECRGAHGTVQGRLRTLGVLGDKHIPISYLRAGEKQRRDILAGLLDTDGTVHKNGSTAQFAVTSRRLAFDVRDLIVSLGYRPTVTSKPVAGRKPDSSVCYTVSFTPTDNVFRLSRKAAQFTATDHPKTRHRYVTAVREIESVPVRCVEVDNADHLYLAGPTCIPTHNSTLGLDLARSASIKNGMTSVIFSLEMSRMEITMRLLSAEARVSLQNIRTGRLSDDDWQRLARRMGEVAEAPLFIDDSPHLTMMEIRAKARRLKQRNNLRLVVLDYLQLMSSPKRVESRQQEVSEISRSMKLLAKELEIPVVAISQLNRASEQRADKKPQLSDLRESGCLTGDTRLVRADTGAEVSLAELVLTGERDVPVWSVDGDLRLVRARLTHAFPSGTKDVYELRLRSGRVVRASANHRFLTLDGWRRLDELSAGTRIAAPRLLPEPTTTAERPEAEIVMLAHLLGDGCVAPRQPIHYTSADEANVTAVETAAAHFGITPRRVRQKNWWHVYLPAPQKLARGRRNPIAAWLGDMGLYGLRSHEKFVPDMVFGLPRAQLALFLRNLWATDGSVRWDVKYGQARIYYASTSRRLVDDMARLLLRFGIYARVQTVRKPPYRDGYHLLIDGVESQRIFLSKIGVHGARGENAQLALRMLADVVSNTNLDTVPKEIWDRVREALVERSMSHRAFAAAMGTQFCGSTLWKHAPSRGRLAKVAGVLDDAELHLVATSDVYWDEVASITDLGPQPVFDATVVGTHNFLADGIVAHNSLEQDADAVILLYREDAVERESARAGEADLIIAKHRNGPTGTVTVAFQGHYSRFVDMAT